MKPQLALALAAATLVAARTAAAQSEATSPPPAGAAGDWRDPSEPAGKRQLYIGLRYRGTIVPQFVMNAFVDEGRTVFSNSVGVELDVRKDRFSLVPHVVYTEYGMQDTLFLDKDKDRNLAANWSYVNSSLKAIYAGVDLLWSVRLHRTLDFEAGLGVGVAYVFGDLVVNWVYANQGGPLVTNDGKQRFSGCRSELDGVGCNRLEHMGAEVAKVGGHVEPSWFSGGPTPAFFARIALPILGLRIKPIRDVEARVQFGYSLTEGFFFGVSGNYRLPVGG